MAPVGEVVLERGIHKHLRGAPRPERSWRDTLHLLASADLRVINLEYAITNHRRLWSRTSNVFRFRADPVLDLHRVIRPITGRTAELEGPQDDSQVTFRRADKLG